jgi:hypothetical protein
MLMLNISNSSAAAAEYGGERRRGASKRNYDAPCNGK